MTTSAAVAAASDRARFLDQVCGLLWPPPATVVPSRGGAGGLFVLPSLRDPRLLVPAGRRAGAAAVRRYGEPGSVRARLGRRALGLALASGAGPVLLRDRLRIRVPAGAPTLEAYLSGQLGGEVLLSLHLGAARANRKPVLQLLTPGGRTVAYAKVGITPLTSRLVQAERAALDQVEAARLATVTAPRVRHLGRWQGLDVLILSALPGLAATGPPPAGRRPAHQGHGRGGRPGPDCPPSRWPAAATCAGSPIAWPPRPPAPTGPPWTPS